jgi:peptidoglycan hydrolase-like protein with peptidoglycan-binding domain
MSDAGQQNLIQRDGVTPVWDPWDKAQIFTAGTLATVPTAPLTYNLDGPAPSPAVEQLQAILDYVLIREAIALKAPNAPIYLVTDGWYGPLTASAVRLFQQEFQVAGGATGVYNAATETALGKVMAEWSVRETTYWDETPRSMSDILALVTQYKLAGIAPWRLGFESPGYWNDISHAFMVHHVVPAGKGASQ